jgi:23S rRNA pseudouridine1911/1915/1917 synthase
VTLTDEELLVSADMSGERIDAFLAERYEELSRGLIQDLIRQGKVQVNAGLTKASYRLRENDRVTLSVPAAEPLDLQPENLPISIIYQDQDFVVVDKAKGMVVHPAQGNWEHTLVHALLYHVQELSGINGTLRPGIVHRLDKDTSGLLVVTKNDQAHRNLAEQIKEHTARREYLALIYGTLPNTMGTIDAPIGRSKTDRKKMAVTERGKPSVTNYEVLERFQNFTLVRAQLLTGRTHQIRVHFAYIKHAVVNDPLYSSGKKHFGQKSQMLHAEQLTLTHPSTGEVMHFTAPLPDYFAQALDGLRQQG